MGKLVVFWSPYIGQAKVTSSLCAIAGGFGIQYPEISIAISNVQNGSVKLAEKLDCRNDSDRKKELYGNFGIMALKANYRQAVLSAEKVKRCAIQLMMKSLYLYPNVGSDNSSDELTFRLLTEHLKKEFDIVFLDLESGKQKHSLCYMKTADYIVVVLPQEPAYIERFFQEETESLHGMNYGILLGGYLEKSKYSERYYTRKMRLRTEGEIIGVIPLNTGFFDSMAEGRTQEFFLKNQLVMKKEDNYEFIVQTKKAAEHIKKKLYLP